MEGSSNNNVSAGGAALTSNYESSTAGKQTVGASSTLMAESEKSRSRSRVGVTTG